MYLNLSKLAFKVLLIPIMSAKPEWLFSSTKLTFIDNRNKLNIRIIKALVSLKS
jgi:hypothetical protein